MAVKKVAPLALKPERFLTIQEIQDEVNKKLGDNVLVLGSAVRQEIPHATSGVLSYDLALGGGWAKNQWNEIIGLESSGKTAIAFKTIAANQALNPDFLAMWVAAEEFVPSYAAAFGVDMDRLWVVESNEMEVALNLVLKSIANRAVDMVVIDSLPALVTYVELSKETGEATVSSGALILSQFFKKCQVAARRSLIDDERGCTMIAINQWRDKIGVLYGDPRTTGGGKAKNYYFFTRLEASQVDWLADGSDNEDRVGQTIKIRVFKNKTYRPHQTAQIDFYFADANNGYHLGDFDVVQDVVNVCLSLDIIHRAGAYYTYKDDRWTGKGCVENIIIPLVREDKTLFEELRDAAFAAVLAAEEKITIPIDDGDVIVELPNEDEE